MPLEAKPARYQIPLLKNIYTLSYASEQLTIAALTTIFHPLAPIFLKFEIAKGVYLLYPLIGRYILTLNPKNPQYQVPILKKHIYSFHLYSTFHSTIYTK